MMGAEQPVKPWLDDGDVRLYHGSALDVLAAFPAESVQTVVTSPPYWGLRSYLDDGHDDKGYELGLESTPTAYVESLVAVFREVWRVLRADGTCWVNLGDSYAGAPVGTFNGGGFKDKSAATGGRDLSGHVTSGRFDKLAASGLKGKDLVGIPWMVAFALRADGWYLRSDIIWAKPNPMPESVTDRPTKAHEYVFLLSKSARYFFDADAIREPSLRAGDIPGGDNERGRGEFGVSPHAAFNGPVPVARNARSVWTIATQPTPEAHFACVDDQTECLTAGGWKHHSDLAAGDVAAQFSMDTATLSWGVVEDVARYEVVDQEMVAADRRDLRMLLTTNHRCVIQRRHPVTRAVQPPVVVRADALRPSHSVPTTAPWLYDGDAALPQEWAELVGWYIAEGHESKASLAVEIYQSPSANAEKCERIESLLRQVGAEWTSATVERVWREQLGTLRAYRVQGYAAARLRELAPAKRIPASALLWRDDLIAALLDGLLGGDGHHRQDGRWSFIQKDARQAGMLQALAIRLGLSATLSEHAGMHTVYITKHQTRSFRGTAGRGDPIGRTQYTGTVWCPKLPDGTWVARRQGRVFITGNTYPEELVRRCVLAGSSEAGECSLCGVPWTRQVERERSYESGSGRSGRDPVGKNGAAFQGGGDGRDVRCGPTIRVETTGWAASCGCGVPARPQTILDPFVGSGTTCLVARRHGRRAIGIDLSVDYLGIAARRTAQQSLLA